MWPPLPLTTAGADLHCPLAGAPKKPEVKDPDKTTEKMVKAGRLVGKVLAVNESKKGLKLEVTLAIPKLNQGALNALAQAHRKVSEEGGQIIAIMPDRQQFSSEIKIKGELPFSILTDMDNGYALSLNLAIWIGDEMKGMMSGRQDLPEYQGNDSWMLPIPATFVVGQDGRIKARFVDPDYRKRMAINDLLAALKA